MYIIFGTDGWYIRGGIRSSIKKNDQEESTYRKNADNGKKPAIEHIPA